MKLQSNLTHTFHHQPLKGFHWALLTNFPAPPHLGVRCNGFEELGPSAQLGPVLQLLWGFTIKTANSQQKSFGICQNPIVIRV